MNKTRSPFLLIALIGTVVCPLLAGCSHGSQSGISPQEQKNFKGGGPMPPEAIKAMQGGGPKAATGTSTPPPAAATPSNP